MSDVKFEQWMKEVDKELLKKCGFYSEFLPDMPYYDWYTDETDPSEAAAWTVELVKSGAMY